MADHAGDFEVKLMGRVLEVSPSGYYAWRGRQPSQREQANAVLLEAIRTIHRHTRRTYGSPRGYAALRERSIACNHQRVERLMRLDGLRGQARRTRRPTTPQAQHEEPITANLLNPDFTVTAPNQVWLAEMV